MSFLMRTNTVQRKIIELKKSAIEGSLAQFFDTQDVSLPLITELLASPPGVASLSNLLQTLWFGANIEQIVNGWTPLLYASKYGTSATVNELLLADADVNALGYNKFSALMLASSWGPPAKVKIILEAKADVNAKSPKGWSPLHLATKFGVHASVQLILEAKANVNAKTVKGVTPIHHALKYRDATMVVELLKMGANVNKTYLGSDVNELAMQNEDNQSILRVLAEHQATLT